MSKKQLTQEEIIARLQELTEEQEQLLAQLVELLGGEEAADDEYTAEDFEAMSLAELKKVAADAGVEFDKKAKKDDLVAALVEHFIGEDEEDEEGDEDVTLEDLTDDELIERAEELDVEPVYSGKGKKKALDREATIEAILEAEEEGDEEVDYDEMSDDELVALAEENDVEPVYTGKGKKKALDRDATIEAIEEALSEDDDEEEGEDDGDELPSYSDEDLDELDSDALQAHLDELVAYMEEEELELPKAATIKGKATVAKLKAAILAIYDEIFED